MSVSVFFTNYLMLPFGYRIEPEKFLTFVESLLSSKTLKIYLLSVTLYAGEEKYLELIEMNRLLIFFTALFSDENSIFLYQASIVSLANH